MRISRICRSGRRAIRHLLGSLSGGNQQKVALAKWLTHLPKVLILSEPTRGMDVGAKEDVIRILKTLRDKGVAILVLSTEPETILTLADRVTVMKKGQVAREFAGGHIEKSDLLAAAAMRSTRRPGHARGILRGRGHDDR